MKKIVQFFGILALFGMLYQTTTLTVSAYSSSYQDIRITENRASLPSNAISAYRQMTDYHGPRIYAREISGGYVYEGWIPFSHRDHFGKFIYSGTIYNTYATTSRVNTGITE